MLASFTRRASSSTSAAAYLLTVAIPVVAVALFATPPPAEACSKGTCPRGYFAPHDGVTIPANANTLVIARSMVPAGTPIATITTDAGATKVPFLAITPTPDLGEKLLQLQTPLEAGKSYAVTHYQSCLPDASKGNATLTFLAGPEAPAPTSSGTIAVAQAGVDEVYEVGGTTACTFTVRSAVVRFGFTPSEDLVPYLGITRFKLTIDGVPGVIRTDYGVDPNAIIKQPYWDRSLIELFAACEVPVPAGEYRGIGLGTHTWSWQAEIAGAATQPAPTTGTFELVCPPGGGGNLAGAGGATTEPSGGSSAGGTSSGSPGGSSAAAGSTSGVAGAAGSTSGGAGGANAGASNGAAPADDGGGCATSVGGPNATSGTWLVGLGLLLGRRLRVRRPRGSGSSGR